MSEQEDAGSEAVSLRDQAIAKLREADVLLRQAGIQEDLAVLAGKQQDQGKAEVSALDGKDDGYDDEYFSCACCRDRHQITVKLKRPIRYQHQYALLFCTYYSFSGISFWGKVQALWRYAKCLWDGRQEDEILIENGEDLRRLKDVLKRLP